MNKIIISTLFVVALIVIIAAATQIFSEQAYAIVNCHGYCLCTSGTVNCGSGNGCKTLEPTRGMRLCSVGGDKMMCDAFCCSDYIQCDTK